MQPLWIVLVEFFITLKHRILQAFLETRNNGLYSSFTSFYNFFSDKKKNFQFLMGSSNAKETKQCTTTYEPGLIFCRVAIANNSIFASLTVSIATSAGYPLDYPNLKIT